MFEFFDSPLFSGSKLGPVAFFLLRQTAQSVKYSYDFIKAGLNFAYTLAFKMALVFSLINFKHGIHIDDSIFCPGMKRELAKMGLVHYFEFNSYFSNRFSVFEQKLFKDTDTNLQFLFYLFGIFLLGIIIQLLQADEITLQQPKK